MPASYPTSVKSFSAKVNGDLIDVSHVKDLEAEVVAVETALVNGLPVTHGGTAIVSYAVGDLLYASGSTTLSKLADVALGNVLLSGGVTTAPAWGAVNLTSAVTGTLPVANGGTGVTTSTGTGANVLGTSPTLATPTFNSAQLATVSGTAPLYMARAWVNFNGQGTVAIRSSGNVSSITDNGTGDYTVNFTTAMADGNYGIAGCGGENTTSLRSVCQPFNLTAPTAGAVRIQTIYGDGSIADAQTVSVQIFR